MDQTADVACVIGMQLLPFLDPQAAALFRAFETEMYRGDSGVSPDP